MMRDRGLCAVATKAEAEEAAEEEAEKEDYIVEPASSSSPGRI